MGSDNSSFLSERLGSSDVPEYGSQYTGPPFIQQVLKCLGAIMNILNSRRPGIGTLAAGVAGQLANHYTNPAPKWDMKLMRRSD